MQITIVLTAKPQTGNSTHNSILALVSTALAYPCRLSEKGAELVLPGISLDEAVRVNEEGG